MAKLRKLGGLAQMLLQSRLQQQSQQQSQQAGFQNQMLEKVLSDPTGGIAERVGKAGFKGYEGFVPKNEDIAGDLSSQIAGENDPTKLMDPVSLISKFKSSPGAQFDPSARQPIEQLINQTNQRREAIRNNAPRQIATEALDNGSKQLRSYNPQNLDTPIQTEVSAQTAGQNDLTKSLEGNLNPIAVNLEAQKAGKITGAQEAARAPYDIATAKQAQLDRIAIEDIKRKDERSKLPPAVAEKVAGVDASLFSLDKIEGLYSKPEVQANVGPGVGRMARAREVLPFVEPNDPDYAAFSAEVSTLNNNVIKAVTGAQMSDPEAKRIMSQVPSKLDKKPDFIAKARATRENLAMLRNRMITLNGSGVPLTPGQPPYNPDAQQQANTAPDLAAAQAALAAARRKR